MSLEWRMTSSYIDTALGPNRKPGRETVTTYEIIKSHRSGWLIDDGSGTSIRYATNAEAERQIAIWERAELHRAESDATYHMARLANLKTYLDARAQRAAKDAQQLNFFEARS
jgi:hypothetical protein